MMNDRYTAARAAYAKRGIDTERAIELAMERELALAIADDDKDGFTRIPEILSLIPGKLRLVLDYEFDRDLLDTALSLGVPIDFIANAEDGVTARRLAAEVGRKLGRASRMALRFHAQNAPMADRIYADKYDKTYIKDCVEAAEAVSAIVCERYGATPVAYTHSSGYDPDFIRALENFAYYGYTPDMDFQDPFVSFDFSLTHPFVLSQGVATLRYEFPADAVLSARSLRRAMLYAELTRMSASHRADDRGDHVMACLIREEEKLLPFADVWEEYLCRAGMGGNAWIEQLKSISQP